VVSPLHVHDKRMPRLVQYVLFVLNVFHLFEPNDFGDGHHFEGVIFSRFGVPRENDAAEGPRPDRR